MDDTGTRRLARHQQPRLSCARCLGHGPDRRRTKRRVQVATSILKARLVSRQETHQEPERSRRSTAPWRRRASPSTGQKRSRRAPHERSGRVDDLREVRLSPSGWSHARAGARFVPVVAARRGSAGSGARAAAASVAAEPHDAELRSTPAGKRHTEADGPSSIPVVGPRPYRRQRPLHTAPPTRPPRRRSVLYPSVFCFCCELRGRPRPRR